MITVIGYPSPVGGADTELWHTVKIWRRYLGVDVRLVPIGQPRPDFKRQLDALGCQTVIVEHPDELNLNDQDVVVSFCNGTFLRWAPSIRAAGAKLVWANCMTFQFDDEKKFVDNYGPFDIHMMQSEFQREQLIKRLGSEIESHCRIIRGAFDVEEWEFSFHPHLRNERFNIGRLARPDADKWSSNTYNIYARISFPDVQAWFMGLDSRVHEKLGSPPSNATLMPPNAMEVRDWYEILHCLMPINGGARENWPRVGLECMALGIPIVAQRQWGWKEMIIEGETGFLGDSDAELAHWAATYAWDDELRKRIAHAARERLVEELACPRIIAETWEGIFNDLANRTDGVVQSSLPH